MNLFRCALFCPFCVAAAVAVALAGCGRNDDPAGPGDGKDSSGVISPPKTGSSFVFYSYETDTGGRRIDSTERTDTVRVVQDGIAIGGKRDAVATQPLRDTGTVYFHYDTNGDFSSMPVRDSHWPLQWRTFPISTKGKNGLPTIREYNSSTRLTAVRNDSTYYEGMEDVTVGGKTYSCHKIRNIQTHDTEGEQTRARYTRDYWYAPEARMFVQHEYIYEVFERATGTIYFRTGKGHVSLVSYSLK